MTSPCPRRQALHSSGVRPRSGRAGRGKNVGKLLAQVESLREAFAREKQRLDAALIFHAAHVRPRQERLTALRTEVVRVLGRCLDDRRLGKADGRMLRTILIEQLDEILAHTAVPDSDVKALFARLHDVGFDDVVQAELDEAQSSMAEVFDALGLDMEVPELRPDMSDEEVAAIAAQMADRMRRLAETHAGEAPAGRQTKRELRAAARAQRFEEMRRISLGAVCKRLVKTLHPDLERDPSSRERKSAVMQEVTTAYSSGDLHTLLRLELEWIDGEGTGAAPRADETLDAYAALLRQQAAQLRADCMELPLHPRYQALLATGDALGMAVIDGPAEVQRLDAAIEGLSTGLERLLDERQGWHEVRELIQMHRRARGRRPRGR